MRNKILIILGLYMVINTTLYGANGSPAEPAQDFDKFIKEAIQDEGKIRAATQALERLKDAIGQGFATSDSYTRRRNQLTEVSALYGIGRLNVNDPDAMAPRLKALVDLVRQTQTSEILDAALKIADNAIRNIQTNGATWNLGPLTTLQGIVASSPTDKAQVASKLNEIADALADAKNKAVTAGVYTQVPSTITPGQVQMRPETQPYEVTVLAPGKPTIGGTTLGERQRAGGSIAEPGTTREQRPEFEQPLILPRVYPTVPEPGTLLPLPTEPEVPVLPQQATTGRIPQPRRGGGLTQEVIEEYVPGPTPGEYEYPKQQYIVGGGPQQAVSYPAPALTSETGALVPYQPGAVVPYRGPSGEVVTVTVPEPQQAMRVTYTGMRGTITPASFQDLAQALVQLQEKVQILRASMPR